MDKFVGKRLDGKYEIHNLIGVGGMAYVYRAYDRVEDRWVAIKILKEEFSDNSDFLRRFRNEAKAITLLSHPNIVEVFDVSFGDRLQYIVMEYIDGVTLKQYIEQERTLRWDEALHFTIQILLALEHAHQYSRGAPAPGQSAGALSPRRRRASPPRQGQSPRPFRAGSQ